MSTSERSRHLPAAQPYEVHLSVVVPSFNRKHALLRLLDSLGRQNMAEFKVIVVIDGSEDGSWEALTGAVWPFDLLVIWQPNSGRSAARNRGVAAAQTNLLLFIDDDMVLESDCVARHVQFHARQPDSVLVGQVPIRGDEPETDVLHFRRHLETGWTRHFPTGCAPFPPEQVYLTAGHFSISRLLFEAVGGFEVKDNWGEDRLLAIQLRKRGVSIWYDPLAVAWHHDPLTFERLVLRLRKEWLTPTHQLISSKSVGYVLKRILLFPFARTWWVLAIDRPASWLVCLPKWLRWLCYRCILTALVYYYPRKPLSAQPQP
jgi:GT2 family glycosyltransferase